MKIPGRKTLLLMVIFFCAATLRFVNLGYSDYQGDETQALYNPKGQTITEFLLSQRRAPVQFLITLAFKGVSNNYQNEFVVRLPFAIFAVLSCFTFYLFVKKFTDEKVALYTSIFYMTNGLFVAFARIVQYQSLVLLLMTLALYYLLLLVETNKLKYLYFAAIIWGLSFLTHSDSLFFLPIGVALLFEWHKKNKIDWKETFTKLVPAGILGMFIVLIFYGPYLLNLPEDAKNYWKGRIEGTQQQNVIHSSKYLFELYQPIYAVHFYILLSAIGIGVTLFNKTNLNKFRRVGLIVWFLITFLFMEYAVEFSGTHIWTYVFSGFIFMGIALHFIEVQISRFLPKIKFLFFTGIAVLFTFLFLQSYFIFVDHEREYPWQSKDFLVWKLPPPNPIFKLSLFGFPYNRHWNEIANVLNNDKRSFYYATNEKKSIPRFYLDDNFVRDNDLAGYYINIVDPQSMTNKVLNARSARWISANDPIKVFYKDGKPVAKIYLIPEDWK